MLHENRKTEVHVDAQKTPKKKSTLEQKKKANQLTNQQINK